MQGLFLDGKRPASKKAVKEAVASGDLDRISVEGTSMFGGDYDGPLSAMPDGKVSFVGPDPYTKRNFYGTLVKRGGKVTVS